VARPESVVATDSVRHALAANDEREWSPLGGHAFKGGPVALASVRRRRRGV